MSYWRVPREWAGETAVIFAAGPSITQKDVDKCRHLRTIAVNVSYQLAPWADVIYGCDQRFWTWHPEALKCKGHKVCLTPIEHEGLLRLENTGTDGLEREPTGLKTGRNGGYQAINLAYHFGARKILLLGFDMRVADGKTHWHDEHPIKTSPTVFQNSMLPHFDSLFQELCSEGVAVFNCTPNSALTAFPKSTLERCLRAKSFLDPTQ